MDHARGLVFHRPQAASHRRAVVYFCSAVLIRDDLLRCVAFSWHLLPLARSEILTLDLDRFKGGRSVNTSLPPVAPGGHVFQHFAARRFASLLPLVQFLTDICGDRGWCAPRLRACFMFDDPNLHATTYGFIDYRHLAERAEAQNYHVSIATIPLDGYFTARRAASLFRQHRVRLSLLIHGNNHTHCELAAPRTQADAQALVADALRRVGRMERVSGVPVARVMAAPHGACSALAAEAMLRLGVWRRRVFLVAR